LQIINFAQKFEADVIDTKIYIDDSFELSFTFSASNLNGLKKFSPPDLSNLYLIKEPLQTRYMQIRNGVTINFETYLYHLKGKYLGKTFISSASIEFEGKIYESEPIVVEFVKDSSLRLDKSLLEDEEISKNLFIKAIADKHIVYIGEKITVTYKLYARLGIAPGMSIHKFPQYNGFKAEELNADTDFTAEVIDGKKYRVGILKQVALFPTQFGELTVTPIEINLQVQFRKKKSGNSFKDDFFTDPSSRIELVDYLAKSNTLRINVLPLSGKK